MDPALDVVAFDAKVPGPFQHGPSMAMMWRCLSTEIYVFEVGTEIYDSVLGAIELGTKVGPVCFGAKLSTKGLAPSLLVQK